LTMFKTVALPLYRFFLTSRRQHTISKRDWSSDVCSSDLKVLENKFKDKEFIKNTELSFEIFANEDMLSRNSKEARDIRYYMEHLGYEVGARKMIKGKTVAGFRKISH